METRPDTHRVEHVVTPEALKEYLDQPRRWSKRFDGIYGGIEPNRLMNASAAARLKAVKIHVIRLTPKKGSPIGC